LTFSIAKQYNPAMSVSVKVSYASRFAGSTAGTCSESSWILNRLVSISGTLAAMALVLAWAATTSQAAESGLPPPSQIENTNLQLLLRNTLQIQQELQATHLALEQNRQEARQAATQNAEAFSNGLQLLQQEFSAQQLRETEARHRSDLAMQKTNQSMILAGGTFAALGITAMFLIVFLQWSACKRLADL
jgi:hypothetical protein